MMRLFIFILYISVFPTTLLAQFGELPPDPISTMDISGVQAEIVIHLLVDRSFLLNPIPDGFTLGEPPEYYIKHLEKKPDISQVAYTTLLVIIADNIVINDSPIKTANGSIPAITLLWVWVENPKEVFDERAIGDQWYVCQMEWYPNADLVNNYKALGIPAEYGVSEASKRSDGWNVNIKIDQSELKIETRYTDEPTPLEYTLPAFMTLWYSTKRPSIFKIYTYYGHYVRDCDFQIEASGNHKLIKLVQNGLKHDLLPADIESKWRAKAGIYRH